MRSVARSACPVWLDGPDSPGGRETARAIEFYARPQNRALGFAFASYKADDVTEALQAMFRGKCAYCESVYAATAPRDADHYRPKGAVVDGVGTLVRPGYYWLAAHWHNLLPSCIDCNRQRRQQVEGARGLSGKGNQFPLEDESRRATAPGEESRESPLLLNPCEDEPADHLEFGDEGVVRAAGVGAGESKRGRTTIEVLGLQRLALVHRRARTALFVDAAIGRFRQAAVALDRAPESEAHVAAVRKSIKELRLYLDGEAEYTLMARQRIARALPELDV